jgi:hypothetical protein
MGRFINADVFTSTGQGVLGNNMFAYCCNNPVNLADPTGEIAITTLILIGSAIAGAASAAYTAYAEYKAGYDAAQIIGDSVYMGMSVFCLVYSLGMTAYQCYQTFCYLNGRVPVTEIGGQPNVTSQLQDCANTANASVSGNGPVAGTKKHTVFANEVNNLGNSSLRTEVSYLNGQEVPYGTKGSIRFDVLQFDSSGTPVAAWDFKTGAATLTASRISQMQACSGLNIPINMVK